MTPAAFFVLSQNTKHVGGLKNEKTNDFYAHTLMGEDAKAGDIGVHLLLDDGEARDTLPNTKAKQSWEQFG